MKLDGTIDVMNSYRYDTLGEMTRVGTSGSGVTAKQASFTYNALGQFTGISLNTDCGVQVSYGYDQANRLTSLVYINESEDSTIAAYHYTYDAASQITQMHSPAGLSRPPITRMPTDSLTGASPLQYS